MHNMHLPNPVNQALTSFVLNVSTSIDAGILVSKPKSVTSVLVYS